MNKIEERIKNLEFRIQQVEIEIQEIFSSPNVKSSGFHKCHDLCLQRDLLDRELVTTKQIKIILCKKS